MKERVLVAIKDEGLLEESTTVLYKHDYLVTKASNLSDMESHLNSTPQDVILLDISIWKETEPDLPSRLSQSHSEASIIHLVSNGDQDILEGIVKNGEEGGHLLQPVTGKEVLLMVDQVIKNKQLHERFKQMRSELLEANKNLSSKTKEFQELIAFHKDIFQNSTVGIITIDTRYIITSWNQCASRITGIKESVAMGSNLFDIIPILGWEKVLERIKAVIQKTEVPE
ncbi:MAG: PAS domain S-box protein, partial [bacterium]